MGKQSALPQDIKQECLAVVRGYRRRRAAYYAARREVIEGSACNYETIKLSDKPGDDMRVYGGHSSTASRTAEDKAQRLDAIDRRYNARSMRAVEAAKRGIGADIASFDLRRALANAIILNCESGRRYPFEVFALDAVSRRDFYRRRDSFLLDIAISMDML